MSISYSKSLESKARSYFTDFEFFNIILLNMLFSYLFSETTREDKFTDLSFSWPFFGFWVTEVDLSEMFTGFLCGLEMDFLDGLGFSGDFSGDFLGDFERLGDGHFSDFLG